MARLGGGVSFGGSLHGFGEGSREMGVQINNPSDVVVKLANQAHVSGEVVGHFGLVILVNFIDQQSVLIQNVLNLNEILLKCVSHFPIHLPSIPHSS